MAANPFFSDASKPDGGRAAHLPLGMFSPMWLPFMAAAGVGAAWWTMQNWPRLIGAAGSATSGAANGGAAPVPTGAARTGAEAASVVRSYQPAPAAANDAPAAPEPAAAKAAPAAPEPAPAPSRAETADLGAQIAAAAPAAEAITESVAIQGAEKAEAPAPAPRRVKPGPSVVEASAPQAAMVAPPAVTEREENHAVAEEAHEEHAKPEPELPPHEGLPARKKGGGKKKG
jgi:hypothetical protein